MALSSARNAKTDHILAVALGGGGLLAFSLIALGAILEFLHVTMAQRILQAGILVLMATPIFRIALAVFAFWREGDHKYALIALAVLTIVLIGALMRVTV